MRNLILILFVTLLVFSCFPPQSFELDEPFRLEYEQTKSNHDAKLHIEFNKVVSDGRCPVEHMCLLAGNASVELTLRHGFHRETFVLNTFDDPKSHTAFGYTTTLVDLAPNRSVTDPPAPEDYVVTLQISEAVEGCSNNDDCPARSEYCRKEQGDCDGIGQCKLLPMICTDQVDPVCGCDGKTYNNACDAAVQGVNVAYKGKCEQVNCWGNKECAEDEYCFFKDCAQETGLCQPRPEECIYYLYAPVCGCDGKTYANSCLAAYQGISIDYAGECQRDTHCDDGTIPACRMPMPECEDYEILAYQENCYACVNPATCLLWGEPNCKTDEDCPDKQTCDMCGSSSCPSCENCVAACINE